MTIYIDLTLVSLFLNGIVSLYFVKIVSSKRIRIYFYVIIGLINLLQIFYMYQNFYIWFIVYLIVLLLLFLKYFKSNYISYLAIYLIFMYISQFIILLFFRGLFFYNGLFYIKNSEGVLSLFSYPIILVLIYLVSIFVDKCYKLGSFKEKVILIFNNKKYFADGFIDTGNLLLFNKIPVIFIAKDKYKGDNAIFNRNVEVNTINGKMIYKCNSALVSFGKNNEFHFVYLCLSEENSFNGCDLLLNGYLL